jgi:hypothetical protein
MQTSFDLRRSCRSRKISIEQHLNRDRAVRAKALWLNASARVEPWNQAATEPLALRCDCVGVRGRINLIDRELDTLTYTQRMRVAIRLKRRAPEENDFALIRNN